jgi:hypothetical protein
VSAEWVASFGVVGAAVVTGVFGLILTRMRKETMSGHHTTGSLLNRLEDKVEDISTDIIGLTVWTKVHEERHRIMEEYERDGT